MAHEKTVGKLAADYAIALALLLQAPEECSRYAPRPRRCGRCWTCRVDKFLRDAGVRR